MLFCDMARVRFYVPFVALLVPCVMFGSMEMFGPQRSVGFMCYIFVLSRAFVLSFVFISFASRLACLRRICS